MKIDDETEIEQDKYSAWFDMFTFYISFYLFFLISKIGCVLRGAITFGNHYEIDLSKA